MMKRFLSMITAVLLAILSASAQNGTLDPTNPPEPSAKYRLTVKAQPAEAATTSGSGEYAEGTQVTVKATAKANYVFKHWLQNGTQISQTATSWKLTMPADYVELVAVFEYQEPEFDPTNPAEPQYITPEYALYLVADPAGAGTFNRTSGAKVKEGATVSIKATPTTGYQFTGWYDAAGTQLSTAQTLSYTMPSQATTLTARFTYNPTNPNEPSGSQTGVDNSADGVVLTARSYTRVYGEANPTFGYDVTSGTITSGTPTLSCAATKTSPVGTYDIIISKGTVSNSSVGLVNGTLTITRAPLTISAGDYTKVEGEANPTFTPTFSGFKNGETKSVLTKQPTVTTTATTNSPAGTYPVSVSGAEAQNYDISYQQGTLTVTPKSTPSELPTLTIEDFSIKAGETAEMLIDLNNPNHVVMGVQFDLRLPEGLSVLSEDDEYYVFIAGRTTSSKHYLYATPKSNGTLFVMLKPNSTTPISGTSGAIISIELTASATFKGGDIRLENIGLATQEGVQFSIDDYVYTLGGQTGQNIAFADPEVKRICVENWDTNGDGELSMDEAAAVTDLGYAFYKTIYDAESFDEFEYFTGLTHIEPYALDGLYHIRSIVIPKNVSEIEDPDRFSMFYDMEDFRVAKDNKTYDSRNDCNALIETATNTLLAGFNTTVIPNSVQHIGYRAFEHRTMWSGTIPEGVLTIGEGAFYFCLFEELTIPSTVTSIGNEAFESCDIEDLYIPANVSFIGEGAFGDYASVENITVSESNPVYDSRDNCNGIVETNTNTLIIGSVNTIIPQSVTAIGNSAFRGCPAEKDFNIPNNVKTIGKYAFSGSDFTSIILPEGLTTISEDMISGCYNITSITIPSSVTSIEKYAFYADKGLTSVILPSKVEHIGVGAFSYCDNLATIEIPASINSIEEDAFEDSESLILVRILKNTPISIDESVFPNRANATLCVPKGSKSAYQAADYWKEFKEIVEMEDKGLVTPPTGLQTEIYYVTGKYAYYNGEYYEPIDMTGYVLIGTEGNDVYIQGLCSWIDDTWIKGVRVGDNVVFPTGQYYGQDAGDDFYFVGQIDDTYAICDVTLNYDSEADEYTLPSHLLILDSVDKTDLCYGYYFELKLSKTFTVQLPGDVNLDGQVGIGDIVAVTNYMAGNGGIVTKEQADVNGDGDVGIGDIVAITNIMAGNAAARQQ